jgi:hypothetical protein
MIYENTIQSFYNQYKENFLLENSFNLTLLIDSWFPNNARFLGILLFDVKDGIFP